MKRIAAAPLWFMVGWFIGSFAAWTLGISPLLAPLVAVALASLIVADPRHVIWARPAAHDTRRPAQILASADAHTT